jgi:hypothetical protein
VTWQMIAAIASFIFTGGGLYTEFRRLRRDVNGMGNGARKRDRNMLLALLIISEKRDDRETIARYLKD